MTHLEEYNNIIQTRKRNPLPADRYGERHHIVPKSICPLLAKASDNIVRLSAQEHFLAHYHIWKAYRDELKEKRWARSMCFAFNRMKRQLLISDDVERMSELYAEVRMQISNVLSETFKGRHLSEEHRRKLRESNIGRKNPNAIAAMVKARRGSHNTKEQNEKNRLAHLGKRTWLGKHHTEETKRKISAMRLGKPGHPQTEDARAKISRTKTGLRWYTNGTTEICIRGDCPEGFSPGRLLRRKDK